MPSAETSQGKEKIRLSWIDVSLYATEIVDHIILAGSRPNAIVAIAKGGLIPAAMIAYHFTLRTARTPIVTCIHAHSYHGELRGEVVTSGLYEVKDQLQSMSEAGQILLVDDISDTGATLAHFKNHFPRAISATLIHKEVSSLKPDFYGRLDKQGDKWWYVFPWE